jgi:hypothetical protein
MHNPESDKIWGYLTIIELSKRLAAGGRRNLGRELFDGFLSDSFDTDQIVDRVEAVAFAVLDDLSRFFGAYAFDALKLYGAGVVDVDGGEEGGGAEKEEDKKFHNKLLAVEIV